MNDKDWEMIHDAIQGISPCCRSVVSLGHCGACGEPVDPIEDEESEE